MKKIKKPNIKKLQNTFDSEVCVCALKVVVKVY